MRRARSAANAPCTTVVAIREFVSIQLRAGKK
jgi:hypothetical protein